jgi:hypothetical protein
MNAMLLELQIQIGVGEGTGTPTLLGHTIVRLRLESGADLATQVPYSKVLRDQAAF